jgi:hypothetical protein
MSDKIRIIHKNCDISLSKDKSLPLDSYLVTYSSNNKIMYDIVQGTQVSIFDYYYDEYRNLISMKWTDGRVNPKLYSAQNTKKNKK